MKKDSLLPLSQVQEQYESLYKQHLAIFNSLSAGVSIYSKDGFLIHCNDRLCQMFNAMPPKEEGLRLNIKDNPVVPQEIKDAVCNGTPIQHFRFMCDFAKMTKTGYNETTQQGVCYVECDGQPMLSVDGKLDNYVLIINDVTDKVAYEEKIRQSQRKIELAMQTADIIFWEFDVKSQTFINDKSAKTRYELPRILSAERFMTAVHPADREKEEAILKRMLNGEDFVLNFEDRVLFPDSQEWQYCAVTVTPFEYNAAGQVVKYVGTRKNNTEIQRRKIFQDKILNSIPIPIHIKDVEDDFQYVFCNDESVRMFGTSAEKRTSDVMDEEEVLRVQKTDLEVFNTGIPYTGLERVELKDGRCYDTIVNKSTIHDGDKRLLLSIRWDQSLQNEHKRDSQLFSLTMEAMKAFTWFYEPDKERISYGDGFENMCDQPSLVGTLDTFMKRVHPEDKEPFVASLQKALVKDSGIWKAEYRFLNNVNVYGWWEGRGILETTIINDVSCKYMFGMTINIDNHKCAMKELDQARKLAEQSDKLKSAFLANMSHEIRTPLNAIVGFSDLLINTYDVEDKKEYMQIINDNTELLLKLINDILDLSKLESGSVELKYEKFDLSEYFDGMVGTMKQRVTNPHIRLISINPCSTCWVYLDRNRVAQILTNYVTNAIKYTGKGFVEMGYECIDAGIRLYVKDSGIGIPDEKKSKVFHRFEKLDEFAQGTGLGLSICKAIAESMGGSVGFESTYGEGSSFWAILPCKPVIANNLETRGTPLA